MSYNNWISNVKFASFQRNFKEIRQLFYFIRFERTASEDITIEDIEVKKGTVVTASAWVIHRDPEVWENPMDFDPDR